MTTGGSSIYWDDGTCRQRIINTDDSTANTAVFNFQQSENSGSSWKNLLEIRDNGRLVLTNKTGGIYRVDDGATNEPLIHLSNNNVDSSIMRIDGNCRTSLVNTQSYGFDLKYIGTGGGESNSLDLIADNMDGANVTAISVSNNGKIGIGDKFNTNYRLYVNGNSYLKGNNFLYGDLSAFYDGVDQYLQYTAEGTVASHAAKISLYRIIASGKAGTAGTKVPGVQLDAATGMLHLQAAASDPSATAGARIKFTYWNAADSNGQPIYISHSINDSYRAPYGLKIWGSDGSAPGAWLEVEGNLYIGSASNSNSNNNAALYIRGMSAIEGYDTWLRLNDNSSFSSGTLSPKLIRSDEALQVGSGGANFYANSSGNGYIQNTFGVHGTDTTKHFFVNGTSRFADDITMDSGSEILFSTNTQYLRWTTNTGDNNSTGRSWYGIGTYQNTSDSNNSWLNISNYWGINITTKGNTCLRHNNNIITTTGNQTGTVGSGTHPIYSSGGVLMASSSTIGSEVRGIYLNAGAITPMSYELKATVNSGTANRVSFYSGSNQISSANGLYTTGGNLGINATTTTANSINYTLYVNGTSYFNGQVTATQFNGPLNGNAATATKLQTTRNIILNGNLQGSASFNGTGDATITALNYQSSVNGGNTSNYPWHRIATTVVGTGQYNDRSALLRIRHTFHGGGEGLVKVSVRTNSTGSGCDISAIWLYRYNIAANNIGIGLWGVTGDNVYLDVYYKCTGGWPRAIVESISNGRIFTLISSNEASDTTTTDKKTSSEVYTSIENGATLIRGKAYTKIVYGSDGSDGDDNGRYVLKTGDTMTGELKNSSNDFTLSSDSNEQRFKFLNASKNKHTVYFYKGDSTSSTIVGLWDSTDGQIWTYNTSGYFDLAKRVVIGGYNNSNYSLSTSSFICDSWIRTTGPTGWYNETYGGGWYMSDNTYIRNYNSKHLYITGRLGVNCELRLWEAGRQITRAGNSVAWITGRDGALIRQDSYTGYNPIFSCKTTNGSWELGPYDNNILYFAYGTDSNYNAGYNSVEQPLRLMPGKGVLLSELNYGTSLPSSGENGQVFFKI